MCSASGGPLGQYFPALVLQQVSIHLDKGSSFLLLAYSIATWEPITKQLQEHLPRLPGGGGGVRRYRAAGSVSRWCIVNKFPR